MPEPPRPTCLPLFGRRTATDGLGPGASSRQPVSNKSSLYFTTAARKPITRPLAKRAKARRKSAICRTKDRLA